MNESNTLRAAMLAISAAGGVVFRNNVGLAVYPDGTRVRYGLAPGSSDLIGWRSVVITPEMVGQRVAVFVAVEVKTATGRATPQQLNFIQQVQQAGGIAGIVRSADEARGLML